MIGLSADLCQLRNNFVRARLADNKKWEEGRGKGACSGGGHAGRGPAGAGSRPSYLTSSTIFTGMEGRFMDKTEANALEKFLEMHSGRKGQNVGNVSFSPYLFLGFGIPAWRV